MLYKTKRQSTEYQLTAVHQNNMGSELFHYKMSHLEVAVS